MINNFSAIVEQHCSSFQEAIRKTLFEFSPEISVLFMNKLISELTLKNIK